MSAIFESLITIVLFLGGGLLWIVGKNRFDEFQTKRRLRKLSITREDSFDIFWTESTQQYRKQTAEFIYVLIKDFIEEVNFHPNFPLRPGDHLLKILGNNEYYIEYIFDITLDEFIEDENFEQDEDTLIFPQLVDGSVDELICKAETYITQWPNKTC